MFDETSLKNMICDLFLDGDREFPLGADTALLQEGICDSMGLVRLAAALEAAAPGLRIDDQDITHDHFGSIRQMLAFLAGRA
ncbi:MAG: hypothetical protein HQL82_04580 [Magnetococcales bacterium]|nr:hypothetical protein [Magnetococcales bacterium]